MSHFAQVKNGIVQQVIVAEQNFIDFLSDSTDWVQTSYNTRNGVHHDPITYQPDDGIALRKNFAGIGDIYDSELDAFYSPQPFPSWILNKDTCVWESPTPRPNDENFYYWNETQLNWVQIVSD